MLGEGGSRGAVLEMTLIKLMHASRKYADTSLISKQFNFSRSLKFIWPLQ